MIATDLYACMQISATLQIPLSLLRYILSMIP